MNMLFQYRRLLGVGLTLGQDSAFNHVDLDLFTRDETVLEHGKALAQAGLVGWVDIGNGHPGATRQSVKDDAPRVDNHAVTIGFATR